MRTKQKYIILLRGVNVGGHRKITMKSLNILLQTMGFENIHTYIQSGNIILNSDKNAEIILKELESYLEKEYGFIVKVFLRTEEEWNKMIKNNFLEIEDKSKLFVAFLDQIPDNNKIKDLQEIKFETEMWNCQKDNLYFSTPTGIGKSKLNNNLIEKKLSVGATSRNWRTILKIQEISTNS